MHSKPRMGGLILMVECYQRDWPLVWSVTIIPLHALIGGLDELTSQIVARDDIDVSILRLVVHVHTRISCVVLVSQSACCLRGHTEGA